MFVYSLLRCLHWALWSLLLKSSGTVLTSPQALSYCCRGVWSIILHMNRQFEALSNVRVYVTNVKADTSNAALRTRNCQGKRSVLYWQKHTLYLLFHLSHRPCNWWCSSRNKYVKILHLIKRKTYRLLYQLQWLQYRPLTLWWNLF